MDGRMERKEDFFLRLLPEIEASRDAGSRRGSRRGGKRVGGRGVLHEKIPRLPPTAALLLRLALLLQDIYPDSFFRFQLNVILAVTCRVSACDKMLSGAGTVARGRRNGKQDLHAEREATAARVSPDGAADRLERGRRLACLPPNLRLPVCACDRLLPVFLVFLAFPASPSDAAQPAWPQLLSPSLVSRDSEFTHSRRSSGFTSTNRNEGQTRSQQLNLIRITEYLFALPHSVSLSVSPQR